MNRLRGIGVDSGSAGSHLAIWMTSSKIAYHAHQSNQPSHHVKQHIEASCLRLNHHSELYETALTATTSQPTRDKRFRSHQEDELILNVRGVCDTTGRTGGIRKKKWVGPGKAPGPTHCIKTFMQAVPIAERTSIETARRHTVGRHQRIPRIKAPRNRESPRMPSKRAIISARSTFGPSYFDSSDDRVRSSRFMPGLSRRERRQSTLPLRSQGYSRANFLFCFLNLSLSVSAMFAVTSFR